MSELYGGVETGGTWCVCAVGRGPCEIVAEAEFPTREPEPTLRRIIDFFTEQPPIVALGIGAFGPVDLDPNSDTWGYVTTTPKPGWQHVPLAGPLGAELELPVAFDTDVNAAALGEQRWGAGRGVETVCYLTVGTGIGTGLVVAGRPWHGLVHSEAGHMRIPHDHARDPFPGSCPVHGDCWEGLASGGAMRERWHVPPEDLEDDHPAWALEADYLALGILNLVLTASPQRMIAGGGVFEQGRLLKMVRDRVPQLLGGYLEAPELGTEIGSYLVAPELGDRAGVLGGLALAQDLIRGEPGEDRPAGSRLR
jgi:fructokinase